MLCASSARFARTSIRSFQASSSSSSRNPSKLGQSQSRRSFASGCNTNPRNGPLTAPSALLSRTGLHQFGTTFAHPASSESGRPLSAPAFLAALVPQNQQCRVRWFSNNSSSSSSTMTAVAQPSPASSSPSESSEHRQQHASEDASSFIEESDFPTDGGASSSSSAASASMKSGGNRVQIKMPIRACCFSRSFDIAAVLKNFKSPQYQAHSFEKDSVIFQLDGSQHDANSQGVDPNSPSYMTVFEFGSVVFINCSEAAQEKYSKLLREFGSDFVPEAKEEFAVLVDSSVDKSSSNRQDCVTVKELDLNNVLIIASVLARSVALDSYDIRVEKLLREFRSINTELEYELQLNHRKISPFMPKSIESKNLVYIIAHNNKLLTDLLLSVRLLESPEIAWDFARYNQTFVGLSREFEIDQRFQYLQNRMSLVQSNTKFFLELLHSKKSNRQEWLIIYLISAELIVGLAPYVYYMLTGHPIIGH